MEEIWADIPGYEGLYKVSSLGRFMSYKNKHRPKLIGVSSGQVQLCSDEVRRVSAKKIVAQVFLNYIGNNRYIKCSDGNFNNISVDNLYIDEPQVLSDEIWRDIKYHTGFEVSDCGRIRRKSFDDVYIVDGKPRKRHFDSMILKPTLNSDGYLEIGLSDGGHNYYFRVHRLVASAFIPNPNNLPEVNHKDGNKRNNSVRNLEWCTTIENIHHSIENGLRKSKYIGLNRKPVPVRCVEDNLEFPSLLDCAKYYGGNSQNLSKAIQYGKKYKGKTFIRIEKEE